MLFVFLVFFGLAQEKHKIQLEPELFVFNHQGFMILEINDERTRVNDFLISGEKDRVIPTQFEAIIEKELFSFFDQLIERKNGQVPITIIVKELRVVEQNDLNIVKVNLEYYNQGNLLYTSITESDLKEVNSISISKNISTLLYNSILDFHQWHVANYDILIDDSIYYQQEDLAPVNEYHPVEKVGPIRIIFGVVSIILFKVMVSDLEE